MRWQNDDARARPLRSTATLPVVGDGNLDGAAINAAIGALPAPRQERPAGTLMTHAASLASGRQRQRRRLP